MAGSRLASASSIKRGTTDRRPMGQHGGAELVKASTLCLCCDVWAGYLCGTLRGAGIFFFSATGYTGPRMGWV